MFKKIVLITMVVMLTLATHGCVSKSTFEEKDAEAKLLSGKLDEQKESYNALLMARDETIKDLTTEKDEAVQLGAEREQAIAALEDEVATRDQKYEDLQQSKEAEVQQMSATYGDLINSMKGEIDKGQVTISELKGKLTVNMVDAVLFASGKAEVKDEGLVILQKVVDILKSVTDKAIRIEGHTDNVRISGKLAQKYPTNWELSSARAINVSRFLQQQGLDPANLSATAYGEFKPVAGNETDEGRKQNRRIEIVLVAKE